MEIIDLKINSLLKTKFAGRNAKQERKLYYFYTADHTRTFKKATANQPHATKLLFSVNFSPVCFLTTCRSEDVFNTRN